MKQLLCYMSALIIFSVAFTGCPTGNNEAPTASFSANSTNGALPFSAKFTDTSKSGGADIASWSWDFGDGATSSDQNPSHVYSQAGTYSVTLTVTTSIGTDSISKSDFITVNRATPVVAVWPSAAPIIFGEPLSSVKLSGALASVDGDFSFDAVDATLEVGTYMAAVTFSPTDSTNYLTTSGVVIVTINKAAPTIATWPIANEITYGQLLSASLLSGGAASVDGSFNFDSPNSSLSAGINTAAVTFSPKDDVNYLPVSGHVAVNVNKATPNVTEWPSAREITYGLPLSASTLFGGTSPIPGVFAFDSPDTVLSSVGVFPVPVTFTPTDSLNYSEISRAVNVTIEKATPVVTTWPIASKITFGQTLAASALSGGAASVEGAFAFESTDAIPNAGIYPASIVFTPSDQTNYSSVNGSVEVAVDKATPTIASWPAASGITFGQTLSASTLTGGAASVEGAFAFETIATPTSAGAYSASVTFTPTDSANYCAVSDVVNVNVNKATPTVNTWPTASEIIFGQTLSTSTLTDGAASVEGAFAFESPETIMSAVGKYPVSVIFTPTDTANYANVSGTVTITVAQATPSVTTWPTASAITYGQALSSSTLSGGEAVVAGEFIFETPTYKPDAGSIDVNVLFIPTDSSNYKTNSGIAHITINKATPSIVTVPSASAIFYGQTLSLSILSGGEASTDGVFTFESPDAVMTSVGAYSANVVFTPTDAANYTNTICVVNVTVDKATPTVNTWPTASKLFYGQALSASTLSSGAASTSGAFEFESPETVMTTVGTYSASVIFVPTDAANYTNASGIVNITVDKATPTITVLPTASAITYGQLVASSNLSGGEASTPGTFAFAFAIRLTAPNAGIFSASVIFTPSDTKNYAVISCKVDVVVEKATPHISSWPTLSSITYGQSLSSSTISGGVTTEPGSFSFEDPDAIPSNAGSYSASIVFTPTDSANYLSLTGTSTLTVNKATPTISTWPAATAIEYGKTLSSSILSGGVSSTPGSFAFETPDYIPNAGIYSASVIFTPMDSTNYNTVSGTTSVTVNYTCFVKAGASGDGSSWNSAFGTIQEGVDAAQSVGAGEVWVAAGIYVSTEDQVVLMKKDVHIYGGFNGTESDRSQRDWSKYASIIDGESTRRCVTGADDSVLDGFLVRNGVSDGGGGIYNYNASPTITNCSFVSNSAASSGGAIYINKSSPTINNCSFTSNTTNNYAGAIYICDSSSPTISDCSFEQNNSHVYGGAIYVYSASLRSITIERCSFNNNQAQYGGAAYFNAFSSGITCNLIDCSFTQNSSNAYGGAIHNYYSPLELNNCIFSKNESHLGGAVYSHSGSKTKSTFSNCMFFNNTADYSGGGLCLLSGINTFTNSVFMGNAATENGGAIYSSAGTCSFINNTVFQNTAAYGGGMYNCDNAASTILNSIFWGDSATTGSDEIHNYAAQTTVTYSCIQGGYDGDGNTKEDPSFEDAANGNFHIMLNSPCLDTASPNGAPDADIEGTIRPQGIGYDMGAYELAY